MDAPVNRGLPPRGYWLSSLGIGAKLGLTCLVLTLMGGYCIAANLHLRNHYEKRDGDPGLSMLDLESAYSGVSKPSPLLGALERNHPPELPDDVRAALIAWLESDRVAENYDNFDLGDTVPADLIDAHCLNCHSGAAKDGAGIALEYWDQVSRVAFSREIVPVPDEILLASAHAHAPTMAVITIVLAGLGLCTRWPRGLTGALILLAGAALLVDLGSWWLARSNSFFVAVIVGSGAVHSFAALLLMILILIDLWRPGAAREIS